MPEVQIDGATAYDWQHDRRLAACAIAAALLLNAAFRDNGDSYYTFLRIYVCGVAAVIALTDWRRGGAWVALSAVLVAILFNPIRPIEMYRDDWFPYDVGAAAWFIIVGGWPLLRHHGQAARGWAIALGLLAAIAVPGYFSWSGSDLANNTMNVDENLTTDMTADDFIDMNATTMDMNATVPARAQRPTAPEFNIDENLTTDSVPAVEERDTVDARILNMWGPPIEPPNEAPEENDL